MAVSLIMAFAALTLGLVRALDPEWARPPLKAAARFIDARPYRPIPSSSTCSSLATASSRGTSRSDFERPHPLRQTGLVGPGRFWGSLERARRIFVVEAWVDPPQRNPLPAEVARRFATPVTTVWRGNPAVAVLEYRR